MFVFFFGLLLELFCNLSLFQNEKKGNFPIPLSEVEYEGFRLDQGERLLLTEDAGTIRIPVGDHVGEVACSYDYDGLLNMTVRPMWKMSTGRFGRGTLKFFSTKNPKHDTQTAWIPVGKETELRCSFPSAGENLYEPGLSYIDFASMPLIFHRL